MMMSSCDSSHDCRVALVEELGKVMEGMVYRRYMCPCLSMRQRARLWALRNQALFGDAPSDVDGKVKQGQNDMPTDRLSLKTPVLSLSVPHWYQFTERLYYAAWTSLRGKMSPHVAAEMLCTEFFYLVKAHSVAPMQPVLEAALSRARAKAASAAGGTVSRNSSTKHYLAGGFYIRGSHSDPIVIALLWLCRAHCIPCMVDFEPLSSKLFQKGGDHFLVKFTASSVVITDPLAAFILCVELYMPQCGHWLGVTPHSSASTSHANRALEKSIWTEHMQHVLADLRLPLLRFMVMVESQENSHGISKGATFSSCSLIRKSGQKESSANLCHQRDALLRVFEESIARYETFASHYRKMRQHSTISAAELCVAAYAFIISTSSLCRELFPPLEAVPSLTGYTGVQLNSQWAQRGSYYSKQKTETPTSMTAPLNTSALLTGIPPHCQVIATRILHAATVNRCSSPSTILVGEVNNGCGNRGKNSLATVGSKLLSFDTPWSVTTEDANDAAIEVVSRLIRSICQPLRHHLGELLSHTWRAANEQCAGFPFLVLDKDLEGFFTTPTTHPQHRVSSCGQDSSTVVGAYWQKLREAFGTPSFSAERRAYLSPAARL